MKRFENHSCMLMQALCLRRKKQHTLIVMILMIKTVGFLGSSGGGCSISLQAEERDTKTEDLSETDNDASKECPDAAPDEKNQYGC